MLDYVTVLNVWTVGLLDCFAGWVIELLIYSLLFDCFPC